MKAFIITVVAVLGMSASMVASAHTTDQDVHKDTFSHNIEHIYDPSRR